MGSRQFCRGRGEARQQCPSLTEARQRARGRGDAGLTSRQGRGEAIPEKPLLPLYSSAKFGRFKSNCMTEGNGLVAPPSWAEVIYVIPLYGVSRGLKFKLELELRGRMLS